MNTAQVRNHPWQPTSISRRAISALAMIIMLLMSLIPGETIASATTASPISAKTFSDVPATSWYASDLRFITTDARKILEGYADGKYYPDRTLSVEQFIKCTVAAAGFRPSANGGHWAPPYIDKALQLGMIRQGQFDSFSRGMTRGEMASVIMSGLTAITGETPLAYDAAEMQKRMSDYAQIDAGSIDSVCRAYAMGILTGYPDGKFHPERVLTRAQATAVVRRMIDATARMKLAPLGDGTGTDMWSDAEFEKFMATDDWKNYLNPNPLSGVKNGKVEMFFFAPFETIDPVTFERDQWVGTLDEPYASMFYQIVKHMAYYAKKYDATATVGYDPKNGGAVEFDFASKAPWEGYGSSLSFSLSISAKPEIMPNVVYMIPKAKDVELKYEWYIRSLYRNDDVEGRALGSSPADFDWSVDKYTAVLMSVCENIYGINQGDAFCNFMIDSYDQTHSTIDPIVLDYAGLMQSAGMNVMFHFPDPWNQMRFYTGEVVERK